MIKKILVGIDTSEHSRNAQAYAFYFARLFSATLIGLHVVDIVSIEGSFFHDISGSLGLEPYLDFSSKMREVLTARGRGVLDEFAAAAKRENLGVETVLDMNERFSTGLLGSTAESVARKSPRQMFISPNRFREVKRPVLAYDGSERASRAMRSAAEFANVIGVPLTVVTVARDPKLGERTLNEAKVYFENYTPKAEFKLLQGHANEEIVKFLKEYDADLLFIGAYGHSRIIEMVLGSTTEFVLRNSPCPVFLAR